MQFDSSNLVNILIAVGGSGGLFTVIARLWLKKHGLDNGTVTEMKKSIDRTETKLDKLGEDMSNIKVSLASTKGEMTSVANSSVTEHEARYNHRGLG